MNNVTLTEYLLSRNINTKRYGKLLASLQHNLKQLFKSCPKVQIEISMRAKTQEPCITMKENGWIPNWCGKFEQVIKDTLEELDFRYKDSEDKETYYIINFED